MNDYIQKQLDKVLKLHQEKNQVINRIKIIKTKKVGRNQLQISNDERVKMLDQARKLYDSKINNIYKNMNLELVKAGHEELENPYENKKGEN
jgi:hypothetical protein